MSQDVDTSQSVIARLHQELVRAMALAGKGGKNGRVTVAEIYQELVPYRAVREAIGAELTADYEHALLRLLAGDGDRVRVEPASARQELQRELKAANPNLGVYRKFAACDAHVTLAVPTPVPSGAAQQESAEAADDSPAGETAEATAEAGAPAEATVPADPPAGPAEEEVGARGAAAAASKKPACNFCRQELPAGRPARFCPFCGEDQRRKPCPKCGEVMEADWRFCIACGAQGPAA